MIKKNGYQLDRVDWPDFIWLATALHDNARGRQRLATLRVRHVGLPV